MRTNRITAADAPTTTKQGRHTAPLARALRRTRGILTAVSLTIATVLGGLGAFSSAQAQLLINLDRAGYPASISTATPHATWHFEWVASGTTRAFCVNHIDPNARRCGAPRPSSEFAAKQEIDIVWEKYDRIGPPVPTYSSGDLVAENAINGYNKMLTSTYRWTGDINGFSASDDRPMLATVHLRRVGTNWTLGSTTSLQFAVNPQIFGVGASATEGTNANMVFNIGMYPPAQETITVDYATQDGTAKAGDDYTATSGTLTFNVGDSVKTVNVPITDDMVNDSGEVFALRVSNPSGVTRLTERFRSPDGLTPAEFVTVLSLSGTILNDEPGPDDAVDNLPLVSVEATAPYTTEGSDAVFKLTRSGETTDALTVSVSTTETGAMLADSSATSATFAAGESEAELRIATVGDNTVEDDSTVTVTLETNDAYRLGANETREARIGVLDDDATPPPDGTAGFNGVTVWSANMSVTDYGNGNVGAGSASLLADQRGSEGLQGRWLYYHTGERKLRMAFTSGLDTSRLRLKAGDVNLPFPHGTSGDSSFTWEDVDVDWSDGETFEAHLVRGEVAATPAPDPTLKTLTISNATISPAFNADTVLYTGVVEANTASVTVSATANDDDATVTFGPSEDADSEAANHQITVGEGDTLTTVTVTAPDGQTTRAYRVIVRRGRTVAVWFDAATYTATESNSAAAVVVKLNANPTHEITIPLTTTPGGGATAADYSAPGSVTFTSGGALSQTVTVTAVADDTAESGETVAIGFGTLPTWVEAGSTTSTTVTLADPPATNTAPRGAPEITGTIEAGSVLTAAVSTITDSDGLDNATFEYQWIANDGTSDTDIDGATNATYTLVAVDVGKTIKVRVTFTDDAGTQETLVSAATTTITAAGLTASFSAMPTEHAGPSKRFTFELTFSEAPEVSYKTLRDNAFTISGAKVKKAKRKTQGSNQNWTIRVRPSGWGDIAISLPGGNACGTTGAICTDDNRMLSNSPSATVQGPAALSVADANAHENTDDALDFAVTLDRASTLTVTVDYATSNGTATAGADYTATSGTLTFAPGETAETVSVPLLDDAIDEGSETMTLTLSNAANARIADGTATGTINNSDPLQQAWIARFGRTVASEVVDGITDRLESKRSGSEVRIAGITLERNGAAWAEKPISDGEERLDALEGEQTMSAHDLLMRSAFRLQGEHDGTGGPAWTAWGRFSSASFEGETEGVKLSGDVTTGLLGADVGTDEWIAGVALSTAKGDGPFSLTGSMASNRSSGTVDSSLTSFHPYAQIALTDRVAAWGIGGYGTGDMTIAEDGGRPIKTDIDMTMAAAGIRGDVLKAEAGDAFDLVLKSDALWLRTTSDATPEMVAATADVTRLRLIVDASRSFETGAGGTLTPSIEAGIRRDGGDAEEGTGFEVGAGLRYQGAGITIEGNVRTLIAHDEAAYKEWGASGAIRIDPGTAGRGLSLTVAPTWGNAASEAEQLWSAGNAEGLVRDDDFKAESRLNTELGYGVGAPHGLGVITPYTALTLSDGNSRIWRAGARWKVSDTTSLSLEGTREERGGDEAPSDALMLRASVRF